MKFFKRLAISSSETSSVEFAVGNVEGDGVAFADGGDRASELSFGSDVAGHQAARGAGETSVGEQRDRIRELGNALDGSGDGEHLAHSRASARAFVANDENIVRVDLSALDGGVQVVLAVEDARGAGVVEALVTGDLDDAAVGREIALENDETAGGLERLVPGVDDGLVGSFVRRASASSARVLPVTVIVRPSMQAGIEQALGEDAADPPAS